MCSSKDKILQTVETNGTELFAMACDIFDHPECGREEVYACRRITDYLEQKGFAVERGIGGLETAFRATWEQGSGGPSIGLMMEYDALRDLGHACGHHLQGPTCIGAALALKETVKEPFKLVLYGTPDEESRGGKIDMVNNGCFRDIDVIFSHHTKSQTCVSQGSMALAPHHVTFHGKPAHAAVSPWEGRSALDALMLAFHGLEIMREHVRDGSRIQYTILERTGPANIIHAQARAHITLRSDDRFYLEDMQRRMIKVLNGACEMTETTYEISYLPVYWNMIRIEALREKALGIAAELGVEKIAHNTTGLFGSTDVGNVSWIVPNLNLNTYYCDHSEHTVEYLNNGKTEKARTCMLSGSKIIGLTALELIRDPAFLAEVKAQHAAATAGAKR
ncbi:MAG: amidohydrolase [Clostridia bacterium]|nr:amidohydrolase [Clostridia bacterium]